MKIVPRVLQSRTRQMLDHVQRNLDRKLLALRKLCVKAKHAVLNLFLFSLRAALSLLPPCCLTDLYYNGENQVSMTAQIKGIAP